ncbi:MAG: two-component system sensor histidine kinase NtrB [Isosphaeraceae bacterium]
MFRVRGEDVEVRFSATAVIVVVSLVLALALNGTAVYQVREEYRLLATWLARPGSTTDEELVVLRDTIGFRIFLRTAASTLLLLCTLATLWLQRRQFFVRKTLDQVKRFANDILASIDQGVITTDRDHIVSSINTGATRLLGVGSEYVGQPLASLSLPHVPLLDLANRVAEHGEAIRDHDCAVDCAGQIRRLRADAHVLKDSADRPLGCVMLLRDVTERALMEERLQRMERFVGLGTLASGLHHEIKNPLTALSLHVQLLEERLLGSRTAVSAEELIGVVKSELLRLTGVLESFRNFANLQRLNLRPTDVFGLLQEIVRLIGPQAIQQQVEVVLRRPELDLPRIALDTEKFKQAVLNLVINGLEAMPRGGVLTLGASVLDLEVLLDVSDTGPGIPPEIQGELFRPYFSTKRRGTGMGLALTEKLIGQHGGRVEFRTGPSGTAFRIAVPRESPIEVNSLP